MARRAETLTGSDALPVSVLMRLMSSQTTAEAPAVPLYRVRDLAGCVEFAAVAFDARRTRQLVLMSPPRNGWQLDPLEVAVEVGEDADVVMIHDVQTANAMAEAITKEFCAYSGAVRILRPGLTESDRWSRHPLVKSGKEYPGPGAMLGAIRQLVTRGLQETRPTLADTYTSEDVRRAVQDAVRKERDKTRDVVAQLTSVKRDLVKAKTALLEEERPVFADPHAQFRYDLHNAWLAATEEGDREKWALREWELGPGFLQSIEEQQIVDRRRVIRACVDVITERHKEIKSRATHQLRADGPGTSLQRDTDGADAWRCSINLGPSAARLMWWERPDGVVELWYVGQHDDLRSP